MPTLVSTSRSTAYQSKHGSALARQRVAEGNGLTLEGVASAHASEVFLLGHDQLGERDTLVRIRIRKVLLEVLVRDKGL